MSRPATVPPRLGFLPFRGTEAVAAGLLTKRMLAGPTWQRLLPDVYVRADAYRANDHRMWCDAARLILAAGAAIGGHSAAFLWGVNLLSRDSPVTVVVPRPMRMRKHPGLVVKHVVLEPEGVTRFAGSGWCGTWPAPFANAGRLPRRSVAPGPAGRTSTASGARGYARYVRRQI